MSAVQAAVHVSRQEVADLQKQAAHVAWRAERWELAGARRRNLEVWSLGQSSPDCVAAVQLIARAAQLE